MNICEQEKEYYSLFLYFERLLSLKEINANINYDDFLKLIIQTTKGMNVNELRRIKIQRKREFLESCNEV